MATVGATLGGLFLAGLPAFLVETSLEALNSKPIILQIRNWVVRSVRSNRFSITELYTRQNNSYALVTCLQNGVSVVREVSGGKGTNFAIGAIVARVSRRTKLTKLMYFRIICVLLTIAGCLAIEQIKGGVADSAYEYDFTVLFGHDSLKKFWQRGSGQCTAFVISSTFLITAAHCIEKIGPIDPLILQTPDIQRSLRPDGRLLLQVNPIKRAIVHPKYKGITVSRYDIALIELCEPIQQMPKKQLILSDYAPAQLLRHPVTAFGYGSKGVLNYADFTVVAHQTCIASWWKMRFWDPKEAICINASPSKTSVPGDSGGPLIIDKDSDAPIAVGVCSFGHAWNTKPEVYTSIASAKVFIDQYAIGHTWLSDYLSSEEMSSSEMDSMFIRSTLEDGESGVHTRIKYRTKREQQIDNLKPTVAIVIVAAVGTALGGLLAALGAWIDGFFNKTERNTNS